MVKKDIICSVFLLSILGTTFIYGNMNDLYNGTRPSSEPYLSGDTFRKYCDHVFDVKNSNFDPSLVKTGDFVFLAPRDYDQTSLHQSLVDFFKNYHPRIKNKYILVTHNSDLNITEDFRCYLESEILFLWFAVNACFKHPKLINIPIGLENELWGRNYLKIISRIRSSMNSADKVYLLFMNFTVGTNNDVRAPIYNYFKNKEFCCAPPRASVADYLLNISRAQFIVSPHGNGLDCHRTWEALYLGCVPIVKKSSLDPLYEDLPVLIVNDWSDVTRELLEKAYVEITNRPYKLEKLFIDYWLNLFEKYKVLCRQ